MPASCIASGRSCPVPTPMGLMELARDCVPRLRFFRLTQPASTETRRWGAVRWCCRIAHYPVRLLQVRMGVAYPTSAVTGDEHVWTGRQPVGRLFRLVLCGLVSSGGHSLLARAHRQSAKTLTAQFFFNELLARGEVKVRPRFFRVAWCVTAHCTNDRAARRYHVGGGDGAGVPRGGCRDSSAGRLR